MTEEAGLRKRVEELEAENRVLKGMISSAPLHHEEADKADWEKKLIEALRLFRRAVHHNVNGISISDNALPDLPAIYVNPAFERITGYCADEILGRNLRFLQGEDTNQEGAKELRAAIRAHRDCHVFLRNYRKDGVLFWNELRMSPVLDEEGNVTHWIGIQNDITERRTGELLLKRRKQRLLLLNSISTRLSSGISMEELIALTLNQIIEYFPSYRISCAMVDARGNLEVIKTRSPEGMQSMEGFRTPLQDEYLQRIREKRIIAIAGTDSPEWEQNTWPGPPTDTAAFVDVAVMHAGHLLGILSFNSREPHEWEEHEVTALREVADYFGFALLEAEKEDHRRKTEDALRESEMRYRAVSEMAADYAYSFSVDEEGNWGREWVTDAFTHITGYKLDEMDRLGGFSHLIFDEDLDIARAHFERLADGRDASYEFRIRRKSGEIRWLQDFSRAIIDKKTGRVIRVIGASSDITDRKKAEQQLSRFFDLSIDAFCVCDMKGTFIACNRSFAKLLGYPATALVGRSYLEFVHPEDVQASESAIMELREGQIIQNFESRWCARDGVVHVLSWNSTADPSEGIIYAVCHDVTERQKADQERLALQQQIQHLQKLESLGLLAGGIAHDFNNLLVAMLGSSNLALLKLPEDSPAREPILQVEAAARQASELTQQLLAYSGKGGVITARLNISTLAEEVLQLLRVSLGRNVNLVLKLAADLPSITGDASQIRQIVMNLILNASEAIGEGGTIHVTTGTAARGPEFLASCYVRGEGEEANYVFLQARDTGNGMDAKTLERIFDPFFTTKDKGRGLGLATVLGIVRSHKGYLRLQSEVGSGTTFEVGFPVARDTSGAVQKQDFQEVKWKASGNILVVDDEEIVRKTTEMMLKHFGFTVTAMDNGVQAVEMVRNEPSKFEAAVLDLTMPIMTGEEVYRQLRQINRHLPILFTSGYHEEEISDLLGSDPATSFIQKPFRAKQLLAVLKALILGSRSD